MSEKKQKVLIVHNYYQIPGGEDTVVANEKKMLEEHGHQVVLYTRHNEELNSFTKLQKLLLPFSMIFSGKTYREVKHLIEKEKIDVVHVHNTLNLISPSVYYAAFRKKVPVVQTIHNFRLLCPGASFYRDGHICEECVSKGLVCGVKHGCYRGSSIQTMVCVVSTWLHRMLGTYGKLNYICLTEFNKKKLLQLKQIREEKVFVKPNFVQPAEAVIPYEQRKDQFVYAGRLEEIKGIDLLLRAWSRLDPKEFKLVVYGTGSMEQWCREYIEKEQLSNVELKGFLDNEAVKKVIGQSKALILPTRWYEGFPMTIAEAYSVGTPVIVSDLGNAGNLVEEGKCGYKFRPDSEESLCSAVEKLKDSFHGMEREWIERYSEESNYEQLRKIYETCCDHNEYSGTLPCGFF